MSLIIESDVLKEGELIPAKFTCDGENVSPRLKWMNAPEATKTFALILEDPDAPSKTWSHWVLYNLPANQTGLKERVQNVKRFHNGAIHGVNDFNVYGYAGPCPPSGTHHYIFRLYALDSEVNLEPGVTRNQLIDAMEGHILEKAEIMVQYTRQ